MRARIKNPHGEFIPGVWYTVESIDCKVIPAIYTLLRVIDGAIENMRVSEPEIEEYICGCSNENPA